LDSLGGPKHKSAHGRFYREIKRLKVDTRFQRFAFSGWWFSSCGGGSRLNGKYNMPTWATGFSWYTGFMNPSGQWWINPNQSEMKLRKNV
jgi:hypothetical protein